MRIDTHSRARSLDERAKGIRLGWHLRLVVGRGLRARDAPAPAARRAGQQRLVPDVRAEVGGQRGVLARDHPRVIIALHSRPIAAWSATLPAWVGLLAGQVPATVTASLAVPVKQHTCAPNQLRFWPGLLPGPPPRVGRARRGCSASATAHLLVRRAGSGRRAAPPGVGAIPCSAASSGRDSAGQQLAARGAAAGARTLSGPHRGSPRARIQAAVLQRPLARPAPDAVAAAPLQRPGAVLHALLGLRALVRLGRQQRHSRERREGHLRARRGVPLRPVASAAQRPPSCAFHARLRCISSAHKVWQRQDQRCAGANTACDANGIHVVPHEA